MTSKEKAIELSNPDKWWMCTPEQARKYAIIAVEQIIAVTHEDPYPRKKTKMDKEYWQEVLQHIRKMQ